MAEQLIRAAVPMPKVLAPFHWLGLRGALVVSLSSCPPVLPVLAPRTMYVTVPTRLLGSECTPSLDSPKSAIWAARQRRAKRV